MVVQPILKFLPTPEMPSNMNRAWVAISTSTRHIHIKAYLRHRCPAQGTTLDRRSSLSRVSAWKELFISSLKRCWTGHKPTLFPKSRASDSHWLAQTVSRDTAPMQVEICQKPEPEIPKQNRHVQHVPLYDLGMPMLPNKCWIKRFESGGKLNETKFLLTKQEPQELKNSRHRPQQQSVKKKKILIPCYISLHRAQAKCCQAARWVSQLKASNLLIWEMSEESKDTCCRNIPSCWRIQAISNT